MVMSIVFVILLVMLFIRVPIAIATGGLGILGLAYYQGWAIALSQLGMIATETVLSYEFAVIPLFILMGNIISRSGLAEVLVLFVVQVLLRQQRWLKSLIHR